jgi:predicted dehydrogenase
MSSMFPESAFPTPKGGRRRKLRVGLVGLGDAWEQRHRPALRALADRFEVRAVCDQVGHRAHLAATEFGVDVVDGFRVLAGREDIDAVLMLSPQWYGALPIYAACESGKAIYFGGGLQLEPEQAAAIRRRVEEAGVAFMAEFLRRQSPATLRLKELIATRLGAPRLLFCHHRLAYEDRGNPARGCRPHRSIHQELVELVDWCRYVVGRNPHHVTGIFHAGGRSSEGDYQMMSLDFSDDHPPGTGALAQISCGRYFPANWHEAIGYRPLAALQVCCENGIAFIDLPSTVVWFDEAGRHQESLDSERPVGEQLLTQFYRAVTSLVRKTSDLDDACQALAIVQEAARSYREGRRVTLATKSQ